MRKSHELPKGVICEKCLCETKKEQEYKRINVLLPNKNDSTGRFTTIHRMNLCPKCYEEYCTMVTKWIGANNDNKA